MTSRDLHSLENGKQLNTHTQKKRGKKSALAVPVVVLVFPHLEGCTIVVKVSLAFVCVYCVLFCLLFLSFCFLFVFWGCFSGLFVFCFF